MSESRLLGGRLDVHRNRQRRAVFYNMPISYNGIRLGHFRIECIEKACSDALPTRSKVIDDPGRALGDLSFDIHAKHVGGYARFARA